MYQYIFYVKGLADASDEAAVLAAANEELGIEKGTSRCHVSLLTSSLTVETKGRSDMAAATSHLAERLEAMGYTLYLPPACTKVERPVVTEPKKKQRKGVPVSVFISSLCALLIVAVLGSYAVLGELFGREMIAFKESVLEGAGSSDGNDDAVYSTIPELEFVKLLFEEYSILETDQDAIVAAVLKAYAEATGDIYADYYTQEELEALMAEDQGEMEGIGVSIVNDEIVLDGVTCRVLTIINVFQNSPALEAGLRMGDHIYAAVNEDGVSLTVQELGYDATLACVRGPAGTQAKFSIARPQSDGSYEILPFEITRRKVVSETVTGRQIADHPEIGLVKISGFDMTTPPQFHAVMDDLIAKGCTKFVFDLRYNPGGALTSVTAVLSTLLNEGDTMITIRYGNDEREVMAVEPVMYSGSESSCTVTSRDIGKYRGYEYAVLVNEYTASAAELFTANLRDYELATVVGSTTFGKGCMQTTFMLYPYGMEGAFKFTTAWYEPPSGENYHDIGIVPDVEIATDTELIEKYGNVYLIPDEEDAQLAAALEALK